MDAFSWENLAKNIQNDAFEDKKGGFEEDSRYYKLGRDKNNNGGALIRFIPSPDNVPFIKMIRINAKGGVNNRFCSDWSPKSIGKKDPFNEMFVKLWKDGKKEEAKKFGRSIRYITNIKVIKDPSNPENEGKIFLLDMSPTLFSKIKGAIKPSDDEMAIDPDLKPKQVYNPLAGNNFLLKVKEGDNKFLTYIDSKFSEKVDGIYADEAEALKDIKANGHPLKPFLDKANFKSYEELQETLDWFMGKDKKEPEETAETEEPAGTKEPEASEELEIETGISKIEEPEPETPKEPEVIQEDTELDDILNELDDV